MKYLGGSFTVGGSNDAYRDGWERTFGKSVAKRDGIRKSRKAKQTRKVLAELTREAQELGLYDLPEEL